MNSPVIVPDASVLLNWSLDSSDETDREKALALRSLWLAGRLRIVLPSLWIYEVGNILGLKQPDLACDLLEIYVGYQFEEERAADLVGTALDIMNSSGGIMRSKSTCFAVTFTCSLLALSAHGQQPAPEKGTAAVIAESVAVPTGKGVPVITDGIFSPGEWDDVLLIPLGDTLELRVKEYGGVVFIGLRGPAGIGPADLFLSVPGGPLYQLHRSAQLAEAIVPSSGELPPLRKFGFTPDWYANEQRWDLEEAERLRKAGKTPLELMRAASYPSDGIEFAIRRSKFSGARWWMRLEATAFFTPDTPAVLEYPPDTGKQPVQRLPVPEGPPAPPKPRVLDAPGVRWLELRLPAARNGSAAAGSRSPGLNSIASATIPAGSGRSS